MEEVVTESPEINTVENDSLQNREICKIILCNLSGP
jgi:hypothetical protein